MLGNSVSSTTISTNREFTIDASDSSTSNAKFLDSVVVGLLEDFNNQLIWVLRRLEKRRKTKRWEKVIEKAKKMLPKLKKQEKIELTISEKVFRNGREIAILSKTIDVAPPLIFSNLILNPDSGNGGIRVLTLSLRDFTEKGDSLSSNSFATRTLRNELIKKSIANGVNIILEK